MTEGLRWEYCQLILFKAERRREHTLYELGVRYFGRGSRMLSQVKGPLAKEWDYNPWERAFGLLGEAGWELVTVQHANSAGDVGAGGEIAHSDVVAYFKRPALPGRRTDEPPLELE